MLSTMPIFETSCLSTPRLRKGRCNRILLFVDCFHPPHYCYLELLTHLFVRTDDNTVAAMLIPIGNGSCGNDSSTIRGQPFVLNKNDRAALLQRDRLLARFSWVYEGYDDHIEDFVRTVIRLAGEDGYSLSFTLLNGSDHWERDDGLDDPSWGTSN